MNLNTIPFILLIEDDESHAFLIKRAITEVCDKFLHFDTLEKAKEFITKNIIDTSESVSIILTDLRLYGSNPKVTVSRIKEFSENIPIIVLTSSTELTDAVDSLKNGAKDFVIKSFDSNFSEVISHSLKRAYQTFLIEQASLEKDKQIKILKVGIEQSVDGFAVFDSKGFIQYSNNTFESFLNHFKINKKDNFFYFFSLIFDGGEKYIQEIQNSFLINQNTSWNFEIKTQDENSISWFEMIILILQTDLSQNESMTFSIAIKNISKIKHREYIQNKILSSTTHDLKGPLGSVLMASEMISEIANRNISDSITNINNKEFQDVNNLSLRIGASAQKTINYIEELLSASKIEEGMYIIRPENLDVKEVLIETIGDFKSIATSKSINLTLECIENDSKIIWPLDKIAIERILSNLISNSIKFTPKEGDVKVTLRCQKDRNGVELLIMGVQDSGCGINPADISKIFENYKRLEKHSQIEGSGIGLFTVKNLVKSHNGEIEVFSVIGKGTEFRITFSR